MIPVDYLDKEFIKISIAGIDVVISSGSGSAKRNYRSRQGGLRQVVRPVRSQDTD